MAHIADFNILTSKNKHKNRNSCSVIINNQTGERPEKTSGNICYPGKAMTEEGQETVVINRDVSTECCEVYKTLSKTLADILKDNNIKLIANIIDTSGKVIIDVEALIQIIAMICQVQAEDVTVEYDCSNSGCCAAINPVRTIENIKVGGLDFRLGYNEKYNELTDTYSISLKKTIIPIDFL